MKIVMSKPVLQLTVEENQILSEAVNILDRICDQVDDYINCEEKCPIYKNCPYHKMHPNLSGKLHEFLEGIVSESEREV